MFVTNPYASKKVVIVGAGLMGCGIAQVFAGKNIHTVICDPIEDARATALDKIRSNLDMQHLDHSRLEFVRVAADLAVEVSDADFVIEAAPEKMALKQSIFKLLVASAAPHCILASNTSVIPIRDIAQGLEHADRIIGTHWWNPPYLVPLVEVVQSDLSAEANVLAMIELLNYVGKKAIHVKKDVTGFVANRMQHALWREAIALINEGVCDAETIDIAVKNSFGLRLPVLGPIENADLVGLDLTQDIHNVVLADLNADSEPANILKSKVESGQLGMKTGSGFRNWTPEQADRVRKNLIEYLLKVTENPFPHSDN
jgi:3-hydroxybutyryl-CoA dehydrogenase